MLVVFCFVAIRCSYVSPLQNVISDNVTIFLRNNTLNNSFPPHFPLKLYALR